MAVRNTGTRLNKNIQKIGSSLKDILSKNVSSEQEVNPLETEEGKVAAKNTVIANTLPNSGNEVLNAALKDKNISFQGLTEAYKIAKEADDEEQKIKAETAQENIDVSNAISETAKNLYSASQGSLAGYETTATKEQVEKDIEEKTKKDIYSSIELPTGLALEKLGVQDYFPTIGDNIITGSFSGRRLGSVTMFGAGGAVIPFGLMDARQRALADAAQKKSAAMQKLQELPDAPEQLNLQFKQYAHGRISALSEKHNYDPAAFMRDPEAMSELYRLQTTAEAMINVDKQFDDIIKNRIDKDGKPLYYIPEELLQQMYDYQKGKLDNAEDYFSGKKNVSELLENARTYADGTRMVDARLAELLDHPRQLPLNVKKGTTITPENIKELESARKMASSTGSYDSYVSALKKFYEIDVDGIVDPWMDQAGYPKDSRAREWVKQYFRAQIPKETVEAKWEDVANKKFDYMKFNKEFEYKKEKEMAYWETVAVKFKNANTEEALSNTQGKINQIDKRIIAIRNSSMSPEEKTKRIGWLRKGKANVIADAYNELPGFQALGFKAQQDPDDPTRVYGIATVPSGERKKTMTTSNDQAFITLENGTQIPFKEFLSKGMTIKLDQSGNPIEIAYKKGFVPKARGTGGKAITFDEDMKALIPASRLGNTTGSAFEHQMEAGFTKGGTRYSLGTQNVGAYANSKDKTLLVTTKFNPTITGLDGTIKPTSVELTLKSDIESFAQEQSMEVLSGVKGETKDKFQGNE